jgi:hypothetical protein
MPNPQAAQRDAANIITSLATKAHHMYILLQMLMQW